MTPFLLQEKKKILQFEMLSYIMNLHYVFKEIAIMDYVSFLAEWFLRSSKESQTPKFP